MDREVSDAGVLAGPDPLVSVVIPAFNAEAFLADAIDSALAQTYENIEVIVVNDGSTDSTGSLARSYGTRVRVVDQENRGIAGARNTAIRHASGSIIALLDADDLWMPERIERCVKLLQSNPLLGFVTTDAYLIIDEKRTGHRYYETYHPYAFPAQAAQLNEIAKRNFIFVSAVFDRRLFNIAGGRFDDSMRAAEDFDLWSRFLLAGASAGLIHEPLAWYRIRQDSVSRIRDKQWRAHLGVLERHLPSLWLRGAHGRPQDAYTIGVDLAARGDRRLATWFIAHAVRDPGARHSRRMRYALGGVWAIIAGRRAVAERGTPVEVRA